jgi:hypothetical protein
MGQLLNIPVKHSSNHQSTKDIQIDADFDWQNTG